VIASGPTGALAGEVALRTLDNAPTVRRELHRFIDDGRVEPTTDGFGPFAGWAAYFGDDALALEVMQRLSKSGMGFQVWGIVLRGPADQCTQRLPGFKTLLREAGLVDYWRKSGLWNEFCKPVGADDLECR
jgi:hypothetical protein